MTRGLEFLDSPAPKPKSFKQKLDKNKFCRKNVISPLQFGPHLYEGTKECKLCRHIKKEHRYY